jgi:hypothetical protein
MSSQLRRETTPVPTRVSPVDRIGAEIDQLFADPARDLAEVVEQVARLGARLLLQTALEAEVTAFLGGSVTSATPTPTLAIATATSR